MAFKLNSLIGWLFAAVLVYAMCQHLGLLPDWAPQPFSKPTGSPPA